MAVTKQQREGFDAAVLEFIGAAGGVTANGVERHLEGEAVAMTKAGEPAWNVVDKALQRLRRKGPIRFCRTGKRWRRAAVS